MILGREIKLKMLQIRAVPSGQVVDANGDFIQLQTNSNLTIEILTTAKVPDEQALCMTLIKLCCPQI